MDKPSSVIYATDMDIITEDMLTGFFVGWPNPPNPATHLKILRNSYRSIVAIDTEIDKVVGFINAVSDGILTAYVPLLEVIPSHQDKGIGKCLVNLMLKECKGLYMVDICHDKELTSFYAKFESASQSYSTIFRDYAAQAGYLK